MDQARFDQLARGLVPGFSRRAVLRALAALGVGGVAVAVADAPTVAC